MYGFVIAQHSCDYIPHALQNIQTFEEPLFQPLPFHYGRWPPWPSFTTHLLQYSHIPVHWLILFGPQNPSWPLPEVDRGRDGVEIVHITQDVNVAAHGFYVHPQTRNISIGSKFMLEAMKHVILKWCNLRWEIFRYLFYTLFCGECTCIVLYLLIVVTVN